MRWLPLLGAVLIGVAGARSLEAQQDAVRFEIANVGDSTFSFAVGQNDWVRRGRRGIAVDPRQRDVLVARFLVIGVDTGWATALITGQRTPITTDHVALLRRPRLPLLRQEAFWVGTVTGGLVGFLLSVVLTD